MKKNTNHDVYSVQYVYLVDLTHSHLGLLTLHLGHLKPPRTFLTRHLFIDGHLLPSEYMNDIFQFVLYNYRDMCYYKHIISHAMFIMSQYTHLKYLVQCGLYMPLHCMHLE